jgi:cytochrome P450
MPLSPSTPKESNVKEHQAEQALVAKEIVFPSADVARCPYPAYAALRDEEPVHRVPGRDGEVLVSRYEDIIFILRNPDLFSNVTYVLEDGARRPATLADLESRRPDSIATFQGSDPPAHTWKRKLSSAHFRPGQVREYEPIIRATVDELIDGFIDRRSVEFISAFARPLGAIVTMLIMGLPVEDARHAEGWSQYDGQGTPYHEAARQEQIAAQVRDMHAYIQKAITERYDEPRDDVLTKFVQAHVDASGEELGLQHAQFDAFSVMLGGVGTSSHMLGNVLMLLIANPEQMARARADQSVLHGAIEESLRLESPVQWNLRLAKQDVKLSDQTVKAGSFVLMLYGAGNRDERHFPDPETFDATRDNNRQHLAFGHGLHFCLGAPLARLEAQVAFEHLFARTTDIQFDGPDPYDHADSLAFRGLDRLDLRVVAAGE